MNTEKITYDIQQMKGSTATAKSVQSIGSTSPPSISETQTTDDDGRSMISLPSQADSAVHMSQASMPRLADSTEAAAGGMTASLTMPQFRPNSASSISQASAPTPAPAPAVPKRRRTKRQLWDDLTISCKCQPHLVAQQENLY